MQYVFAFSGPILPSTRPKHIMSCVFVFEITCRILLPCVFYSSFLQPNPLWDFYLYTKSNVMDHKIINTILLSFCELANSPNPRYMAKGFANDETHKVAPPSSMYKQTGGKPNSIMYTFKTQNNCKGSQTQIFNWNFNASISTILVYNIDPLYIVKSTISWQIINICPLFSPKIYLKTIAFASKLNADRLQKQQQLIQ